MNNSTEQGHTKGLLKVGKEFTLEADNGVVVAECWTVFFNYNSVTLPANARRLTACWNACDDIETVSLEAGGKGWLKVATLTANAQRDTAQRQARELRAILDELETSFDKQVYEERKSEDFDALDEREYSVNITAKQLRAISTALAASEGVE